MARLERLFDGVLIHDAIMYMTSEMDLHKAIQTTYLHCRKTGVAMFVPDFVRETFKPSTKHGGHDRHGRGLRYLAWTYDPDREDDTYLTDFAYLIKDTDGSVLAVYDRHIMGLFPRYV